LSNPLTPTAPPTTTTTASTTTATSYASTTNADPVTRPPEPFDDESLRAYLDGHAARDVLDLLLVIRNRAPVRPAPHDHPIMRASGFAEQQTSLDAVSVRLDAMLGAYIARGRGKDHVHLGQSRAAQARRA